jgi:hypothetical protein
VFSFAKRLVNKEDPKEEEDNDTDFLDKKEHLKQLEVGVCVRVCVCACACMCVT